MFDFVMKMFSDGDVAVPAWAWRKFKTIIYASARVFNVIRK
jgi:hypothetical protein